MSIYNYIVIYAFFIILYGFALYILIRWVILKKQLISLEKAVLSACLIIPPILFMVWMGGWYFVIIIGIVYIFALREIFPLFKSWKTSIPAAAILTALFSFFILLRNEGFWNFLRAPFIVYMGDTGARLIGNYFGKHKLAPKISPFKTIEGAIGGVICAIITSVILSQFKPIMSIGLAIILGLIVGLAGIGGDLVESKFKRRVGIKDSSNLIPGHGGMLDELDSVFPALILTYCFVKIFNIK